MVCGYSTGDKGSKQEVSLHTPKTDVSAFEKLVFGGEIAEFDRELDLYHKLLQACGVPSASQENVFSGTLWRILNKKN